MLQDSFGRVATDLRVSLTDRCNLRCSYCMPPEGLDWLPKPELLTDDEIVRLVPIGVERLGITEVRYTGGEPLLRRGLRRHRGPHRRARPAPGDLADHQRHRAGPRGRRARRGRPRPGQRLAGHPRPRDASRSSPTATGWPTCWPAWRRPPRPGSPRSRSTRC